LPGGVRGSCGRMDIGWGVRGLCDTMDIAWRGARIV